MIGHLVRLAWNRRRANALVFVELLLCFLVLCAVLTMGLSRLHSWRRPLGFDYRDVWRLDVQIPGLFELAPEDTARWREVWQRSARFEAALRDLSPVEAVAPLPVNIPFTKSSLNTVTYLNGERRSVNWCATWPDLLPVLRLQLRAGRWLEEGDAALNWRPVVVTEEYARALFGRDDPLGQTLPSFDDNGRRRELKPGEKPARVVGVVADYRRRGELGKTPFSQFHVHRDGPDPFAYGNYLVRVRSGTTAKFEEGLLASLRQACPEWSVNVTPLARLRRDLLRADLLPLAGFFIVVGFLLTMVGLGLIGVLWQSVTRRREEMGLRRALGAAASDVQRQIQGELLTLAALAAVLGAAIVVQLPILQVFDTVTWPVFAEALLLSALALGSFVLACSWYPSRLAARLAPAEALQHE